MRETANKSNVRDYLVLIRPYQWIKNLLLFSPLFFSGYIHGSAIRAVSAATVCFCLTSSIGYILNDWLDRHRDRFHHEKKKRPFCSGRISGFGGALFSFFLFMGVSVILFFVRFDRHFLVLLLLYFLLSIGYSLYMKHVVILELFSVSLGFVLRVLAGGAASGIVISSWLFLTVFFISMLISVAKRFSEYKVLGADEAVKHRISQAGYTETFLEHILWISGGITLVVYALYVVDQDVLKVYSVLPASYGIFRFIYLTEQGKGSDPIKALFSDRQLMLTTLVFFVFLAITIYF